MKRRDFIKTAALSTAAVALNRVLPEAATPEHLKTPSSSNAPSLLKREYGKTGIQLSIIGLPGLMLSRMEQDAANRIVAESFERGVNYFDVAASYGRGSAETRLGPALEPYRKKVFLSSKTRRRTREGAEFELKQSLERLKTDYVDLYLLHGLNYVENDVDAAFKKGGAMEILLQAKKEGRVRYLGFSAHTIEAATAAMDRYDFDSLLFPFNFASILKLGFGPQAMEKAEAKGVARIALKACVRAKWASPEVQKRSEYARSWYQPLTEPREQELGLRFSLGQPITAALPPSYEELHRRALDIAMSYRPLDDEELREVKAVAATVVDPLFPRDYSRR